MLLLGQEEFETFGATITGSITDPYWYRRYNKGKSMGLMFGISISSHEKPYEAEINAAGFEFTIYNPITNWHNLDGHKSKWEISDTDSEDDKYGIMHMYEHEAITRGNIHITQRIKNTFSIEASGTAIYCWNPSPQTIDFKILTTATFEGIYVSGSGSESLFHLKNRLSSYIDTNNLQSRGLTRQGTYNSGIPMVISLFEPKI